MDATAINPEASSSHTAPRPGFFSGLEVPVGMALMRICLPAVLLIDVVLRHPWARELYSLDGAPAPLGVAFGRPDLVPTLPGAAVVGLHAVLIASLLSLMLGWHTRLAAVLACVLYTWFGLLDSVSTITKYTVIATHLLVLLAVSPAGRIWSLDAWRDWRRGERALDDDLPTAPIWSARLVQFLMAATYLGASLTKMHTPTFFSGDQLMYWTMTYVNNVHPLGDWLSQHPLVLSLFGYITIVWEITFLFLIFQPKTKWPVIAIGFFFHLMTMFTLGLYIFPLVMYSGYLAFVNQADARAVGRWLRWLPLREWGQAWPPVLDRLVSRVWPAPPRFAGLATHGLVLVLAGLGAIEVERWRDPYQERGEGGPLALDAISDDEVVQLFAGDRAIRGSDKVLAFDVGDFLVGEHLPVRKSEFVEGERLIAQATLTPPREDMWLDCWLHEALPSAQGELSEPGRAVVKLGQAVGRELFRMNFQFNADGALPPGEYILRLRSGRDDLAWRRFRIVPKENPGAEAVSAN
jgi:hypothetical protein